MEEREKKSSTMSFPNFSAHPAPIPKCLSHPLYTNKEEQTLSTVLTYLYYFSSPLVHNIVNYLEMAYIKASPFHPL